MVDLVTVEEANDHLRLDLEGTDDEFDDERLPDLELKIAQASDIVIGYLKKPDNTWTAQSVPPAIKAATLLVLSALWEDREGTGDGDFLRPDGAVARLLVRHRDPAIA